MRPILNGCFEQYRVSIFLNLPLNLVYLHSPSVCFGYPFKG